jgi:hypothetical protein
LKIADDEIDASAKDFDVEIEENDELCDIISPDKGEDED